jgi:hypothetical protein
VIGKPASYYQIRTLHFTETLAGWARGLDKTAFALLATVGPGLVAILALLLLAIANGLTVLYDASSDVARKSLAVCAWQAVSLSLLWSLREALLMPRASNFFAALPIPIFERLRADLAISALSYSVLWLPVSWALVAGFFDRHAVAAILALLSTSAFVILSLFSNLLLLRGRWQGVALAITVLAIFALTEADSVFGVLYRLAAVGAGAASVWRNYMEQPAAAEKPRVTSLLMERISIRSGLAISFFAHELRTTLLIRVSAVFGLLAVLAVASTFREPGSAPIGGFVFVVATAAIALHSLPAVCRSTAFAKLLFVAGQKNFTRRLSIVACAIPIVIYICALLGAYMLTISWSAPAARVGEKTTAPTLFFTLSFLAGMVASIKDAPGVRWLMPVVNVAAAIAMSGFV